MSLTHEVRGSLARCLATENIIVEHKDVDTAMFDVDKRILTLPNWKKASDVVYQMLILHETSHAIFSHNLDYTEEHKDADVQYLTLTDEEYANLFPVEDEPE